MNKLGKRIQLLRLHAGKTPEEYARIIGVSRPAVLKWENGMTANLKVCNLLRIAEYHQISLESLLKGDAIVENLRNAVATQPVWPFSVAYSAFARLPKRRRDMIDDYIRMVIKDSLSEA